MSAQHTPGAMIAVGHWVENHLDSKPDLVTSDGIGGDTDEEKCANARRIAACWNACDGMTTKDAEACPPGGLLHLAAFSNAVVLQRDELLAALDGLLNVLPSATTHPAIQAAKAARAKATGEKS